MLTSATRHMLTSPGFSDVVPAVPSFPRIASSGDRITDAYQRVPEQPVYLGFAPGENRVGDATPKRHNSSGSRAWAMSHFSDTSGSNHTDEALTSLPRLQINNEHEVRVRGLGPLPEDVVDPDGFDLAPPARPGWERPELFSQERRSLLMFSKTHLRIIFRDLKLLRKFSAFLVEQRPASVPLLVYHLDTRKALAAIKYANAVTGSLQPLDTLESTREPAPRTDNEVLRKKAEASFARLATEDLPAWITSVWMKAVEVSIRRRINGSLPSQLREYVSGDSPISFRAGLAYS